MTGPHPRRWASGSAIGRGLAALAIPALAVAWSVAPAGADEPALDASPGDATTAPSSPLDGGGAPEASAPPAVAAQPPQATPAAAATDGGAAATATEDGGPRPLSWDERLSFGIRAEYAFPFGAAVEGGNLSHVVAGVFLVGGELGYQIVPRLNLLAYFFYGFPSIAGGSTTTCNDPTAQCSANLIRFGVVGNYHFTPYKKIDPWVGLSVGWEVLNVSSEDDTGAPLLASSLNGLELGTLFGVEYRPGANFGLGPYVEGSAGHYFDPAAGSAIHGWLTIGIRVRTGP
jgi:hypothetical protein